MCRCVFAKDYVNVIFQGRGLNAFWTHCEMKAGNIQTLVWFSGSQAFNRLCLIKNPSLLWWEFLLMSLTEKIHLRILLSSTHTQKQLVALPTKTNRCQKHRQLMFCHRWCLTQTVWFTAGHSLYCGCVFMCEWTDVRVHASVVKTLTADPWRLLMCKSVRSKIVILLSPLQIRSHSECFYFNWLLEFQPYVCGIYHMSIIKWSPVSYWHTKGLKEAYQRWGWIS